ncbi:putative pentatricopeptide repeat-containing protein At5g47460 [Ziziphus jujuba]|uniref:Pentatricopeptide repeat-containing protein At5g47460 n=1 Tax=Ziziphus jujuba TaxID=326968 RepID=A0ABM3I2W9_ZIZJJ|nr:putative pentatricopeptide repeat-containing protein At5g47460 [Ziziphus jujuba]
MQRSLFKSARKYIQKQKHPHLFCGKYISSNIHLHNHFADYGEAPQSESYDSWTNLIFALAKNYSKTAQTLFEASEMLGSGIRPNEYALVHLVQASMKLGWNFYGQQLHSYILRSGFSSNVFVSTALIGFYIRIDLLTDAQKVFVDIPHPSVVSWNSLISGCVHCGKFRKALSFFYELDRSNISADSYSLTAALTACGHLSFLQLGKSIHSKVVKLGVESTIVPSNCLIGMYGKCGSVEEAVLVFNKMVHKDTISWNSVIAANTRNGSLIQAVGFLQQMPSPNTLSYNELIFGFAQFGDIEDAIKMLSTMPNPNSSSWNSIITGYVNRNRAQEALDLFYKMHSKNIEMDQFTFSSILSGVAGLSALTWGMLIHCCTIKCGLETSAVVGSALIDMYSKCGQVKNSESIFKSLPEKNLVTWNAMITGYAHNGNSSNVICLFEQLKMERNIQPDEITFLNVLSGCSHNGIPLEIIMQYFKLMIQDCGIEPTVEHCCCMVRLMGQRGELLRAKRMIYELGFGACGLVWRAFLGACEACKDLRTAKTVAGKVIELGCDNEYLYIVLSNISAYYGKWEDVRAVRKLMMERAMRKGVGYSWIEVEDVNPSFYLWMRL